MTSEKAKAKTTRYLIFRKDEQRGGTWVEHGGLLASNAEQAIRKGAKGEGTFVAVPERQWKPRTVKVETVEKLHLGEPVMSTMTSTTPVTTPAKAVGA